jgi:hypothetical protein
MLNTVLAAVLFYFYLYFDVVRAWFPLGEAQLGEKQKWAAFPKTQIGHRAQFLLRRA